MGQPIDIEGPLGGLSQNMSPRHIAPTDFVVAENVVNVAGVLRPRPGRTLKFAGEFTVEGDCFFDPASPGAAYELALDELPSPDHLYYIFQAAVGGGPSVRRATVTGTGDTEIVSLSELGSPTAIRGLRYSSTGVGAPGTISISARTKLFTIETIGPSPSFNISILTADGSLQTTTAFVPTDTAAHMESAIEALSNVQDVTVTRGAAGGRVLFTITFVDPDVDPAQPSYPRMFLAVSPGPLAGAEYNLFTVTTQNLTDPFDFFTLTVQYPEGGFQTSAPIAAGASAVAVKAALEALINVTRVDVTKTIDGPVSTWTILIADPVVEGGHIYPLLTAATASVAGASPQPGYMVVMQGGSYTRYVAMIHPERAPGSRVRLVKQFGADTVLYGGAPIRFPYTLVCAENTTTSSSIIFLVNEVTGDVGALLVINNPNEFRQATWNADDSVLYATNSTFDNPDGVVIHVIRVSTASPPSVISDTRFNAPYPVSEVHYNAVLRRLYFTTDGDTLGTQNVYFCPVGVNGELGGAFQIAAITDILDHPRGIAVDSTGNVYWTTVRE